jgi:DNA repair protein RadA/Sms
MAQNFKHYNAQVERALLSSVLFDGENFKEIFPILKISDFSIDNGKIFKEMISLRQENKPIDDSFLLQRLDPKYEEILLEIISANPIVDIASYVHELKELSYLRETKSFLKEIDDEIDGGERVEVINKKISDFSNRDIALAKEPMSFSDWKRYVESLPKSPRYDSGIQFFDYATGGVDRGRFVLLHGPQESGKTSFGLQWINHTTTKLNQKATYYCWEFTVSHFVNAQLEINSLEYENENLFIEDRNENLHSLVASILEYKKRGVYLFLIDSQMRIEVDKARNMEEEEGRKFNTLGKLAKKENITIVLISQENSDGGAYGSKKGGYEADLTVRIETIKPSKTDIEEDRTLQDKPFHPKRRMITLGKNKISGKHFREVVGFNSVSRTFYSIKDGTNTRRRERSLGDSIEIADNIDL